MNLDLRGKTVTEAIARIRHLLAERKTDQLVILSDNEAVKLNLIREIGRMGFSYQIERSDGRYRLVVSGTGRAGASPETAASSEREPPVRRQSGSAFPLGHLSGDVEDGEARGEETTSKPMPREERTRWLILSSEQIGHRDPRLGFELMEDLLSHLDTTRYVGVFLVHRGVLLLDPMFQGGRGLRVLLRKNIAIMACEKSLEFYDQRANAEKPVEVAPLHTIGELDEHHDLVWL